jgi:hypothetical protein
MTRQDATFFGVVTLMIRGKSSFREAMMDGGGAALSSQPPAQELWVELPSHFGLVLTRPILVDHETDLSDPTARLLVDGREGSVSVPLPTG